MTTVALYFPLNTDTAKREAKSAVAFIRSNFFLIPNLQGVGFLDSSGKPIAVLDSDNRPVDLTYFTFRSVVTAADIDDRAPQISLSLDDKAVREGFWQELWVHVPSTRKKQKTTVSTPDTAKRVPLPPTSELSYHAGKHPRRFAIFACVSNLTSTSQKTYAN